MSHGEREFDARAVERLTLFSDAVAAIAITVLALDLPVPEGDTVSAFWSSVRQNDGHYAAFLISFLAIAGSWSNHHDIFRYTERTDSRLRSLNMAWLLTIVLIPFATRMLTEIGNPTLDAHALRYGFYALLQVLETGALLAILRHMISHDQATAAPAPVVSRMTRQCYVLMAGFALSIPIFFVTTDAWVLWFAFPLLSGPASRLLRRNHGTEGRQAPDLVRRMADVFAGGATDDRSGAAGTRSATTPEGCDGMTGGWSAPGGFFTNPDFDYEARIVLGAAASGIGDVGLVLATLDRVTDGDPQSWFDAWTGTAADLATRGDQALGHGHSRTASWALLAAAECYAKALMFADGLADQPVLLPTFRRGRDCWEKFIDASQGRFVRVQVPYEDTTLAGYLLRPDATGAARPTLVVTNGSDGSLPGLLGYGGYEALARGWNVFVFDGPGQQSMLFERGVPFRYDWEAVLTPVIDCLITRPDVDAAALLGYAISQGGYWITRAVAFERRLVAAIADPGVVDVSAGWTAHLPPALLELLDSGQKDTFNAAMAQAAAGAGPDAARTLAFRGKPYGMTDPFDLFTEVRKYQVRDVACQITTPLLILDPDNEQFFPGQPRELYDLLPGEKEIIGFTQAQGANFHCQPTGRQLTHTQMLDWLADHLPPRHKW
jgi:uncharacterized membrane protein